ncbi:VOC family protein [Candidatus Woesebacteria bacterium]|nr:VOC family protein [Candidatus Woesebacteria bacterium]
MAKREKEPQKIEWTILLTDKYPESRKFYVETLGLAVEREVAKDQFCQMNIEGGFLAIYGRGEFEKLVGVENVGSPGCAIYTFAESENIDAEYKKLKGKGVIFIKVPTTQPWGQRTAYFTDPDGHIWEIQQWVK